MCVSVCVRARACVYMGGGGVRRWERSSENWLQSLLVCYGEQPPAFYVLLNPRSLTSWASQQETLHSPSPTPPAPPKTRTHRQHSDTTTAKTRLPWFAFTTWLYNGPLVGSSKQGVLYLTAWQLQVQSFVSTKLPTGVKKDVICWVRGENGVAGAQGRSCALGRAARGKALLSRRKPAEPQERVFWLSGRSSFQTVREESDPQMSQPAQWAEALFLSPPSPLVGHTSARWPRSMHFNRMECSPSPLVTRSVDAVAAALALGQRHKARAYLLRVCHPIVLLNR